MSATNSSPVPSHCIMLTPSPVILDFIILFRPPEPVFCEPDVALVGDHRAELGR